MSGMKQQGIVLSASTFDFEDASGKRLTGCTVHALMTNTLTPYEDDVRPLKGHKPVKLSFPLATFSSRIVEAPGLYDLELGVEAGSDGKMKVTPIDLTFVRALAKPKV